MDARPKSAYEMTAITSLYGIDNQSKREITIHDKNKASSKLHVYGSSVSMEEAVRSTVESVSQDTDPVTPPPSILPASMNRPMMTSWQLWIRPN